MGSARILVIDDNPMNIELTEFVLASQGYEVVTAHSAAEGLIRIAAQRPDLILMDIQMPDMDGLELTRRLKSDPVTRDIIVVAFTAYAMKGDEQRVREAGCDGYLPKPIDVKAFGGQIERFLQQGCRTSPSEGP